MSYIVCVGLPLLLFLGVGVIFLLREMIRFVREAENSGESSTWIAPRPRRALGCSSALILPIAILWAVHLATWPYTRGFPPAAGPLRWDLFLIVLGVGLLLTLLVALWLYLAANRTEGPEKKPPLPSVGTLWRERESSARPSEGIKPQSSEGTQEHTG